MIKTFLSSFIKNNYIMSFDIEGRIFVGGLDHDCDETVLENAFKMFGEISQVLLIRNRETGLSRGFAFISFKASDSADDAIQRMHGVEVMGRCVTVKRAERQGGPSSSFQNEQRFAGGGQRPSRGGGFSSRNEDYQSRGRTMNDNNDGDYQNSRRGGYEGGQGDYNGRSGYNRSERYASKRHDSRIESYEDLPRTNRGSTRIGSSRQQTYDRSVGYGNEDRIYDDRREVRSQAYEDAPRSRSPVGRYARDNSPPPRRRNISPYQRGESPPVRSVRRDYRDSSPVQRRGGRNGGFKNISSVQDDRLYGATDNVYQEVSSPPRSRTVNLRESPPGYNSGGYRRRGGSPSLQRGNRGSRSPAPRRSGFDNGTTTRVTRDFNETRDYQSSRIYGSQERSGI